MAFPRYNVKTGAIILAMIGLLGGGFSVILYSVDEFDQAKRESMIKFKEDTQKTEEEIELYEEFWNRLDILKSLVPWAFVVQIVSSASNILINGSMLYGVTQKKARFMLLLSGLY